MGIAPINLPSGTEILVALGILLTASFLFGFASAHFIIWLFG